MSVAYDSRVDTLLHISVVRELIGAVVKDLVDRADAHDRSKLESPEREAFDEMTPRLAATTFGSEEYERARAEMSDALEHHYRANQSHHPDAVPRGIRGMTLVDLVEMTCDWVAASRRHDDGDPRASVEKLQARFRFSDELKEVFLNTVEALEEAA